VNSVLNCSFRGTKTETSLEQNIAYLAFPKIAISGSSSWCCTTYDVWYSYNRVLRRTMLCRLTPYACYVPGTRSWMWQLTSSAMMEWISSEMTSRGETGKHEIGWKVLQHY